MKSLGRVRVVPHVETIHERPRLSVSLAPLVVSRLSSSGYSFSTVSSVAVNCVTNGCLIPICRITRTQTELAASLTRTAWAAHGGVVSTLRRTVCADNRKQRSNQLYRWHQRKHITSCNRNRRSSTVPAPVRRIYAGLQSCLVPFPHRF